MKNCTEQQNKIVLEEPMAGQKLDNGTEDKKEHNIVSLVAPEILMKVFTFAYPKRASTLRLVCKQWRDVFNDNYEIKAKLNDENTTLPNFFQYRRVTQCTVVHFRKEHGVEQNLHLFQDPTVLTKLTILGSIAKWNFLLLAEQCTNVRELIITGASLETEAKLFESEILEENIALKMFVGNLRKLVITGAYFHTNKRDPGSNGYTSKNLITLFGFEMPNLTTLVVRVNTCKFLVNEILDFIAKCGALKHVDIDYRMNGWFLKNFCVTPRILVSTLNSLKISVDTVKDLKYWLPLIKIQRKLETLQIRLGCNRYCDYAEEIVDVIKNNKTLKEIQIDIANFHVPE